MYGIREYIHCIGRTARIGSQGLDTLFHNDCNEALGQDLVNVLLECEQVVPEFLKYFKPEVGGRYSAITKQPPGRQSRAVFSSDKATPEDYKAERSSSTMNRVVFSDAQATPKNCKAERSPAIIKQSGL
ncbi:hypothetical protein AC578_1292 [Pseudocercospora eumusae]|uniref:Helicase C-terminal domain-containing protein n=1 Tax=Pseudocercospora eumusae TaxID=321146 RepID=A0A139HUJ9_9PEZI|nr:hypothetical protein AC578_1292 [Pseudocercospora eumusae]